MYCYAVHQLNNYGMIISPSLVELVSGNSISFGIARRLSQDYLLVKTVS